MRTRELKRAVQQSKQAIGAIQYVINILNGYVKVMGEQTEKLVKDIEQKTAKKPAKKPAVVSKKGGKPSKIEKPAKKTVKTNPVKKIKKAIKKAK